MVGDVLLSVLQAASNRAEVAPSVNWRAMERKDEVSDMT
jgi:hypothetical protein